MNRTTTTRITPNETMDEPVWQPIQGSGFAEAVKAVLGALAITLPIFAVGGMVMYADYSSRESGRQEAQARLASLDRLLAAPPLGVLPVSSVQRGWEVYASSCAACHAHTGTGVPGLGKDLVHSWFVASLDDAALDEFIHAGRAADAPDNTTGIPMPPLGGQDLTSEDVSHVVAYLRGLQDPRRMPALPEGAFTTVSAAVTDDDVARFLAAAGGDEELAEYIASGSKLYAGSCMACHGKDARGVEGNGKDLVNSDFCNELDDDSLLAFIKRGRDPGDPANTTGIGMPAKGGNPALDDDDILDIIAYVRSLQDENTGTN